MSCTQGREHTLYSVQCRPPGTFLTSGWSSWRTPCPPPCTSHGRCIGPCPGSSCSWPPGRPTPRPSRCSTSPRSGRASATASTGWTTRSAATAMELPTSRQRSRDQSCRAMRGFLHPDCGPRAAYSNNFQEKRILSKTTSQSPKVNSTPINCARVGKYFRTSEYYYDDFKTNSE